MKRVSNFQYFVAEKKTNREGPSYEVVPQYSVPWEEGNG